MVKSEIICACLRTLGFGVVLQTLWACLQCFIWFYFISNYFIWIYFVSTHALSCYFISCINVLFQSLCACFWPSLIIDLYYRNLVHVRSAHLCIIFPFYLFYLDLFWDCILATSSESYACLVHLNLLYF